MLARYTLEQLKDPVTYLVAAVVGTLINAYGHLLVPYVDGQTGVLEVFVARYQQAPGLTIGSIALAYVFPMFVGVFSSVRTRYHQS